MIVVLSHAADATADFACARLDRERIPFVRVDTDFIVERARFGLTASGARLTYAARTIRADEVSCVWFRRPRPIRVAAEDPAEGAHASAEWAEAFEGFLSCVPQERWINHPARAAFASHKIEQLVRASRFGFTVPVTLVTQDENEARRFLSEHQHVIVKPLSGGFVERAGTGEDTLIYTTRVLREHAERLSLVERCPVLFQAEIEKAYDVRVTAVDGRFSAVALRKRGEDGRQITDIRKDNWEGVDYQPIKLPRHVAERLSTMLGEYSLRFAAVDFAVDVTDQWVFFEVNTGGQWAWLDMQAGTDIAGDLAWAMTQTR